MLGEILFCHRYSLFSFYYLLITNFFFFQYHLFLLQPDKPISVELGGRV